MTPTPTHRVILNRYRQWREWPPTVGHLLVEHTPRYVILLLIGVVGVGYLLLFEGYDHSILFVSGLVFGAVLRDIGLFRKSVQAWPLVVEITDWNRVDQLVNQTDELAPPT